MADKKTARKYSREEKIKLGLIISMPLALILLMGGLVMVEVEPGVTILQAFLRNIGF